MELPVSIVDPSVKATPPMQLRLGQFVVLLIGIGHFIAVPIHILTEMIRIHYCNPVQSFSLKKVLIGASLTVDCVQTDRIVRLSVCEARKSLRWLRRTLINVRF